MLRIVLPCSALFLLGAACGGESEPTLPDGGTPPTERMPDSGTPPTRDSGTPDSGTPPIEDMPDAGDEVGLPPEATALLIYTDAGIGPVRAGEPRMLGLELRTEGLGTARYTVTVRAAAGWTAALVDGAQSAIGALEVAHPAFNYDRQTTPLSLRVTPPAGAAAGTQAAIELSLVDASQPLVMPARLTVPLTVGQDAPAIGTAAIGLGLVTPARRFDGDRLVLAPIRQNLRLDLHVLSRRRYVGAVAARVGTGPWTPLATIPDNLGYIHGHDGLWPFQHNAAIDLSGAAYTALRLTLHQMIVRSDGTLMAGPDVETIVPIKLAR